MKFLATSVLAILLLAGCSSPEAKMQREQQKADALKESSGFNACMKTFDDYDAAFTACKTAKLRAAGYTDDVDCSAVGGEKPPCNDTARYNAGVYANNDCLKETPDNRPDGYACVDLLER